MILRPHVVIPRRAQALLSYIAAVLIGLLVPPFALGVAVTLTGCATLQSAGGAALGATIDCGRPLLQAQIADISGDVQCALSGGAIRDTATGRQCIPDASIDWLAELDELKDRGMEALACAVAKVGVALAAGSAKPPAASIVVTPADHASFYLQTRNLHPSNVLR